jgi:putative membrane protein
VRHGNGAAAVALGGVMLALALPLGVSMVVSGSLIELVVWGIAVTLVELLLLRLADITLRGLPERIRDGDVSAAVLLTCARLATAILLACAIAG